MKRARSVDSLTAARRVREGDSLRHAAAPNDTRHHDTRHHDTRVRDSREYDTHKGKKEQVRPHDTSRHHDAPNDPEPVVKTHHQSKPKYIYDGSRPLHTQTTASSKTHLIKSPAVSPSVNHNNSSNNASTKQVSTASPTIANTKPLPKAKPAGLVSRAKPGSRPLHHRTTNGVIPPNRLLPKP